MNYEPRFPDEQSLAPVSRQEQFAVRQLHGQKEVAEIRLEERKQALDDSPHRKFEGAEEIVAEFPTSARFFAQIPEVTHGLEDDVFADFFSPRNVGKPETAADDFGMFDLEEEK